MIGGILHLGSGAGDQIFRLITSKTIAEEKGFEWGMVSPENFKCSSFMSLEIPSFQEKNPTLWNETDLRIDGIDRRSFDPEINFIKDNTIIDGSFEDARYWHHNLKTINDWLKVTPLNVPDNRCIIGFRGGEYAMYPDLFLTKDYYRKAIAQMLEIDPNMEFEVHTDDPVLALTYFPEFPIVDNQQISHSKHTAMAYNWRAARYAKYAIIPNSAFFIIPRILKHFTDPKAVTLAPRWWARRNTKGPWRPAAYYKEFLYV